MSARLLLAAAVAALSFATPAFQPAAAREQLSDEEMDKARGGILVADGVAFEFGAVVNTYEDGVLRLQTQLTATPNGPLIQQTAGQNVSQLTGQLLSALAGPSVGKGAVVTDSGAVILQQFSPGQITNLIVNSGSDHSFRQDTNVTLTLPGFAGTQADIARQLTGMRLSDDLHAVQIGAN